MKLSLEERKRVAEFAGELRNILGGEKNSDGRSKTFAQLEDECIAVGDLLTASMLEQRVNDCEPAADEAVCPDCQRRMRRKADDEPRLLQTDRGEVGFMEPAYHCRHCRRSFFPTVV